MIGGGKEKGSTSAGGAQSWRSLASGPKRGSRVNSRQAQKRRRMQLFKLAGYLLACAVVLGGITWAIIAFINREEPIQIATPSKPVKQIIFDTDGVLPSAWLGTVIELRRDTTMMEVDIHAMKQQLEAHGQVRSASVEREFPSALKIMVQERVPTLRMRVMGADEQPETRIVARDGTLYKGAGYPKATLRQLPFVVPYQHPEGGIKPMRGIEKVADLIDATRRTQPQFYRTWQLISLKHYSGEPDLPGQIIEVKTTIVPRIIFGLNSDFAQQLDRLAVILNYVQSRGNPAVKRIDLSLLGSAAVQFESGRISTF